MKQRPYALFVTETCKPNQIHDATLSYKRQYTVFSCDRQGSRPGGGVLVAIRKGIPHNCVASKNFSEYCQVVVIETDIGPHSLVIATVYRSPSCKSDAFQELIEFFSDIILQSSSKVVIMGDFYFPLIEWSSLTHRGNLSNPSSSSFIHFCASFNLDSTSDHCSVSILLSDLPLCRSHSSPPRPCFAKGDFVSIVRELTDIHWLALLAAGTVNKSYSRFIAICHALVSRYVPPIKPKAERIHIPRKIRRLRAK
ncbi:hypothetical protein OSTOST_02384 [Ostertagia ostertagi]